MAIDCYVMPLWRFFAGEFATATQRMLDGDMRRVIIGDEPRIETPKHSVSILHKWRGKRRVRELKQRVSRQSGQSVDWADVGDILYQAQYHHDDVVTLYIAWRSLQEKLPPYEELLRYHDGRPGWQLVNNLGEWRSVYPHLYGLGFTNSVAIPCRLAAPVKVWPRQHFWGTSHTKVHSGPDALQEVEQICNELGIDEDSNAWEPGWENRQSAESGVLKDGAATMRHVLRLGHQHRLPVMFW